MTDIFDAKVLCKHCDEQMEQTVVKREGTDLRALRCLNCGDVIIHPADLNALNQFQNLRGKIFSVKLRVIGNSHAISIPKEIVEFINEQHRLMQRQVDDVVRLCFEDFDTLKVRFGEEHER